MPGYIRCTSPRAKARWRRQADLSKGMAIDEHECWRCLAGLERVIEIQVFIPGVWRNQQAALAFRSRGQILHGERPITSAIQAAIHPSIAKKGGCAGRAQAARLLRGLEDSTVNPDRAHAQGGRDGRQVRPLSQSRLGVDLLHGSRPSIKGCTKYDRTRCT